MILTPVTPVYDINQKILTKKKRLLPKFQFILILHVQVASSYA